MIHAGSYLIIMKKKTQFSYDVFGVIPNRGIDGDGQLSLLNNQFFKLATNTPVNVEELQGNGTDGLSYAQKSNLEKQVAKIFFYMVFLVLERVGQSSTNIVMLRSVWSV